MLARLRRKCAAFGGDDKEYHLLIGNDTGSGLQDMFISDLQALHYDGNTYRRGRMGVDLSRWHENRTAVLDDRDIVAKSSSLARVQFTVRIHDFLSNEILSSHSTWVLRGP